MLKEPRSKDICCHFWKYATFLLILFPVRVVVLLARAFAGPHTCITGITWWTRKKREKTLKLGCNWTSHWRLAKNLMRLRIFKQLNLFIGTFNDLANPSRATCPDSKVHKAPVEILTATTHEAEKRFTHDADSPFWGWMNCFSLW